MSYLLRVVLPDRPGTLGLVATALGLAGGDIQSLDVVERGSDGAVDDILVDLPGGLADVLITAAQSVPGVIVESLRPYRSGQDIHRDLELVDLLAVEPERAVELLGTHAPGVFRAGWGLIISAGDEGATVVSASPGAPSLDGLTLPWLPLASARRMDRSEEWVPTRWDVLGMEMAAAPVGSPDRVILIGRPGGPLFRAGEVVRLAHLAGIAATVAKAAGRVSAR